MTPVITYAGATAGGVEVFAAVNGIVESEGTCAADFTGVGGASLRVEVSAAPDASSTLCEPIVVPSGVLAPGSWTVVVGYVSTSSEGTSAASSLQVG